MKRMVIMIAVLMAISKVSIAQDKVDVPKEALQWMASLVGEWEATGTVNGEATRGTHSAQWVPGEHCIRLKQHWTGAISGHASAIGGWSPEQKRYVEYWFVSNGSSRTHWYALEKENGVWPGGLTQVDKEGKKTSGKIRLEKTADGWSLVATGDAAGEKTVLIFKKIK